MISEAKSLKLIKIYTYVCKTYNTKYKFHCERFSNNKKPKFTDQEIITIYLFVLSEEKRFQVKAIYSFAKDYLNTWFPDLGSYQAFNNRINRLSNILKMLCDDLINDFKPVDCSLENSLLDSMPVIICSGKRKSKVAREIADKTYCATKNMWYYGLKIHALNFERKSKVPFPEQIHITNASENDLNLFKEAWVSIDNRNFFGDKIYHDKSFFTEMEKQNNSIMHTPIKAVKGQCEWEKKFNKAFDDLYSTAVSSVRQPIESFFNWLIEKTDIQRASKVRSTKGLLVHVFGKLAAAFIYLIL